MLVYVFGNFSSIPNRDVYITIFGCRRKMSIHERRADCVILHSPKDKRGEIYIDARNRPNFIKF